MDDYGDELPAVSRQQINERFDKGSERMAAIERDLKAATQELYELKQQLADLLEFFTAMKGAFKVLNWVGKVASRWPPSSCWAAPVWVSGPLSREVQADELERKTPGLHRRRCRGSGRAPGAKVRRHRAAQLP